MTYPLSEFYIVVDSKKCQGCQSCMMTCSLVHEGEVNLSLSRIQVMQDILKKWPDDIKIVQCRQCTEPLCVQACPSDACRVDVKNGNIRIIDEPLCIGCQACLDACSYVPHRAIWNVKKNIAVKCDLCLQTSYWDEKGGPQGKQACVEICPQNAIKLVRELPEQIGDEGYDKKL